MAEVTGGRLDVVLPVLPGSMPRVLAAAHPVAASLRLRASTRNASETWGMHPIPSDRAVCLELPSGRPVVRGGAISAVEPGARVQLESSHAQEFGASTSTRLVRLGYFGPRAELAHGGDFAIVVEPGLVHDGDLVLVPSRAALRRELLRREAEAAVALGIRSVVADVDSAEDVECLRDGGIAWLAARLSSTKALKNRVSIAAVANAIELGAHVYPFQEEDQRRQAEVAVADAASAFGIVELVNLPVSYASMCGGTLSDAEARTVAVTRGRHRRVGIVLPVGCINGEWSDLVADVRRASA